MENSDSSPKEEYSTRLSFLYAAISDMQAVIRAVDTKVSAVLVIFSIAFSKLGAIYFLGTKLYNSCNYLAAFLLLIFILSWIVGFYSVMMTLIAIDDPRRHINGSAGNGAFYCGDLYVTKLIDSFEKRSSLISRLTWEAHSARLPSTDKEIFEELSFEQMKLAYIRSLKMRRALTAYIAVICWVVSGGLMWLLALSASA